MKSSWLSSFFAPESSQKMAHVRLSSVDVEAYDVPKPGPLKPPVGL